MQMLVLYFEWILLFSLLAASDSLTEPADKEKLLGCLCHCRIVTSGKIRILIWIHTTFSKCTASTAWITSLHMLTWQTPLWQLQEKTMSNQCGVKAFLQPYPALLDHVHRRLFLEGCCFSLSMSIQVIEKIFDHYRLVQTVTKCSGNHPFWLEGHLCEGASITLGIQGTGALALTHHLHASVSVSSLHKWGRLSLFFPLRGLGRNQHCLYFFLSMQHVNTLAQLSCSKHSYVDFLNISSNLLHIFCHEALQLSPQDPTQTGKYDVPIQRTSQMKSPMIKLRHKSLTDTLSLCVFARRGPKTREKSKTNQQQTWGNACRRVQHQRHPWHASLACKMSDLHGKQ